MKGFGQDGVDVFQQRLGKWLVGLIGPHWSDGTAVISVGENKVVITRNPFIVLKLFYSILQRFSMGTPVFVD